MYQIEMETLFPWQQLLRQIPLKMLPRPAWLRLLQDMELFSHFTFGGAV